MQNILIQGELVQFNSIFKSLIKFYSSSINNKSPLLSIIPNYLIFRLGWGGVSVTSSDDDSLIYLLGGIILSISSISSI